jgi:tetratricopeptide (TPR) repeat protein
MTTLKQQYLFDRLLLTTTSGSFAEVLGTLDEALQAYERVLIANPQSVQAMNAISLILRTREEFNKAVEYLQAILKLEPNNGEVWGSLGKLFLFWSGTYGVLVSNL